MTRIVAFAGLLAALVVSTPGARACGIYESVPFETDPAEVGVDTAPPGAIGAPTVKVWRGHGSTYDGCGGLSSDSCQDTGSVHVTFDPPADDRTPADRLGYRVEFLGDGVPDFVRYGEGVPIVAYGVGTGGKAFLAFSWIDGAGDVQESIDFTVRIRAVDLGGNEGPPVDVEVSDPGSGGCAAGPRGLTLAGPLAVVALSILARRLRAHVGRVRT